MIDPTAYDNADFIPDGHSYFPRWAEAAGAFRASHPLSLQKLDLSYGPGERQAFDLFLPEGPPKGLHIFIHGGFWRLSGRKDWSHLASGTVANGWAVAIPSYPLAPDARIAQITQSMAMALWTAAAEIAGPILISGHSAGGHLSLRMVCQGVDLPDDIRQRIVGVLPISPLADLEPLTHLPMNEALRIDADEVKLESPIHYPAPECAVQIEVGGAERPAFVDQAKWMAGAWPKSELTITEDRHHFDILDPLADPESRLVRSLLAMAG